MRDGTQVVREAIDPAAEVPEGWTAAELRLIVSRLVDGSHNPPAKQPSGVPMLSARNIENGRINWNEFRWISKSDFETEDIRTRVRPGDVLLTIVGSIGRSTVIPAETKQFALQRSVAVMKPNEIHARYLMYAFHSPFSQRFFEENGAGTAQKGVYLRTLLRMPIRVAPIAEQARIVTCIEKILTQVDGANERLSKVQGILKRFRQAVLTAACSGKLTEEWRKVNEAGGIPQTSTEVEGLENYTLPDSWAWAEAGRFYVDARYGTSVKCDRQVKNGVPVLRVPNIAGGQLDLDDLKYSEFSARELNSLILELGDILICRTNGSLDLIGKAAVIPVLNGKHTFASYLIRLRLDVSAVLPHYFHMVLSSRLGRDQIEERARTTAGQFNLNLEILRSLILPVPPVLEQHEIVCRVEGLFKLADAIEKRVVAATARAEKLTQAVLGKAFKGELVPTEAELARLEGREYESASAMLERIQAGSSEGRSLRGRSNRRATASA